MLSILPQGLQELTFKTQILNYYRYVKPFLRNKLFQIKCKGLRFCSQKALAAPQHQIFKILYSTPHFED